jgi:hypothetical protein
MEKEVEKAIQFGGTQRLRDRITDLEGEAQRQRERHRTTFTQLEQANRTIDELREMLEKVLPYAACEVSRELFKGGVGMEEDLEMIRKAEGMLG